jgi:hypothetical protein
MGYASGSTVLRDWRRGLGSVELCSGAALLLVMEDISSGAVYIY